MTSSASPCRLTNVLGDHAVLQRDRPAMVWGFADPGTSVTTTFQGVKLQSTADGNGTWRQALPAQPATTAPTTISFTCSTGESFALNDVLFGDVHLW
jgi:sialate O-acetylesterase